jgi:hypothetical protein
MSLIVIICRAMVVSMVGIPHWIKGIHFPAKIIHVSAGRFKHLFLSKIVCTTRKFNFHFKSVKQLSYEQGNNYILPVCRGNLYNVEHHTNHNQCQRMTPHKLKYFLRSIQSMLKFVNGIYLHVQQQFSLIKFRIAQILLKIHKLNGAIPGFSQYSSQNNNTIRTKL